VQRALEDGNFVINTGGIGIFLVVTSIFSLGCVIVVIAAVFF